MRKQEDNLYDKLNNSVNKTVSGTLDILQLAMIGIIILGIYSLIFK